MKVFIWGLGNAVDKVIAVLNSEIELLGFIDSDEKQQQRTIMGKKVYSPDIVLEKSFDYVIISARIRYKEISDQLEMMSIKKEKIIQFYNYTLFFPRIFFYNDTVVKDDRYNLLFENYVDSRLGG